jgi:hypothetical protein
MKKKTNHLHHRLHNKSQGCGASVASALHHRKNMMAGFSIITLLMVTEIEVAADALRISLT